MIKNFETSKQAAARWGISHSYALQLLRDGKIKGAKRYGWMWLVPKSAKFQAAKKV